MTGKKAFISSTTVPVFKYLIDPQMLGVSSSVVYQLTDYIGYDIMPSTFREPLQQARAMIATGNYPQTVLDSGKRRLSTVWQILKFLRGDNGHQIWWTLSMKSLTAVRKKALIIPLSSKIKMVELSHRPEIS